MKKDLARILPVIKHMSVTYKPSPGVKLLGMLKKRVEPYDTWFLYPFLDFRGWEKPFKVAISKG